MLANTACPGFIDGAVIGQHHEGEEALAQRGAVLDTALKQRCGMGIDHDKIGFVRRGELPNVMIQRERFSVTVSQAVKPLPSRQRLPPQLANFSVANPERSVPAPISLA